MAPVEILAFAGSLRRDSYNRALLRAAIELAPEGMAVTVFDLHEVPLYDGDVEAEGDPPGVQRFKAPPDPPPLRGAHRLRAAHCQPSRPRLFDRPHQRLLTSSPTYCLAPNPT